MTAPRPNATCAPSKPSWMLPARSSPRKDRPRSPCAPWPTASTTARPGCTSTSAARRRSFAVCDEGHRYLRGHEPSRPWAAACGLPLPDRSSLHPLRPGAPRLLPDDVHGGFAARMAGLPEEVVKQAMLGEGSAYGVLVHAIQRGIDEGAFPSARLWPGRNGLRRLDAGARHGHAAHHGPAGYPADLNAADHQVLLNFIRGLQVHERGNASFFD